jgi:hypothetical protein
MDSAVTQVALAFGILVIFGIWVLAARQMGILPHTSARVVSWFVLTGVTLWFGYTFAFIGVHALLFAFGSLAAAIGFLVTTLVLAATPFFWALVIHRMGQGMTTQH